MHPFWTKLFITSKKQNKKKILIPYLLSSAEKSLSVQLKSVESKIKLFTTSNYYNICIKPAQLSLDPFKEIPLLTLSEGIAYCNSNTVLDRYFHLSWMTAVLMKTELPSAKVLTSPAPCIRMQDFCWNIWAPCGSVAIASFIFPPLFSSHHV